MYSVARGHQGGSSRWVLRQCCVLALLLALFPSPVPAAEGAQAPDAAASGSATAATPAPAWLLMRADSRARGLPGFGPNAFEALAAEYRMGGATAASPSGNMEPVFYVWATREALWFSPTRWDSGPLWRFRGVQLRPSRQQRLPGSTLPAFAKSGPVAPQDEEWLVLALDRPFTMAGEGGQPALWSLFFAVPATLDASARDQTLSLYIEQFARFLERAKSPADVSLPAIPARER